MSIAATSLIERTDIDEKIVFVPENLAKKPFGRAITTELIKDLKEKCGINKYLARAIAANGKAPFASHPEVKTCFLKTKYDLAQGTASDQSSSGRCWIFSTNNGLRFPYLKTLGEKFKFSSNYIAFWDKLERANYIFEKMLDYKHLGYEDQNILNLLENLWGDGGEWELFVNVIEKYGIVPDYAMPETSFSVDSAGYMEVLAARIKEIAGYLHKKAKSLSDEELQQIKNDGLKEVYTVLISYLGEPPEQFSWAGAEDKFTSITPLEFVKKMQIDLSTKVHLTCLPYVAPGCKCLVKDIGNVIGSTNIRSLNISVKDLKDAIRQSIKSGEVVGFACDLTGHDRDKNLLSIDNDETSEIFKFNPEYRLDKGEKLNYRINKIAHMMLIVGCDDETVDRFDKPSLDVHGPLWKIENSWGEEGQYIYMTDKWFDEHVYEAIVDKKYLSEKIEGFIAKAEIIQLQPWDPFGRIL